jgi:archaellum component FlaC
MSRFRVQDSSNNSEEDDYDYGIPNFMLQARQSLQKQPKMAINNRKKPVMPTPVRDESEAEEVVKPESEVDINEKFDYEIDSVKEPEPELEDENNIDTVTEDTYNEVENLLSKMKGLGKEKRSPPKQEKPNRTKSKPRVKSGKSKTESAPSSSLPHELIDAMNDLKITFQHQIVTLSTMIESQEAKLGKFEELVDDLKQTIRDLKHNVDTNKQVKASTNSKASRMIIEALTPKQRKTAKKKPETPLDEDEEGEVAADDDDAESIFQDDDSLNELVRAKQKLKKNTTVAASKSQQAQRKSKPKATKSEDLSYEFVRASRK